MPVTGKNILGIVGLAVIALFWVALNGVLGGLVVVVLIVLVVVILNASRRKRPEQPKSGDASPSP